MWPYFVRLYPSRGGRLRRGPLNNEAGRREINVCGVWSVDVCGCVCKCVRVCICEGGRGGEGEEAQGGLVELAFVCPRALGLQPRALGRPFVLWSMASQGGLSVGALSGGSEGGLWGCSHVVDRCSTCAGWARKHPFWPPQTFLEGFGA